jgi:hypothetical protein
MTISAACPLTPDYPVVPSYPRAFCICTGGVPLEGHFTAPASEIPARDKYDNHPAIGTNPASAKAKLDKEEEKSFHIHLPHICIHSLPGLILAPLQWAIQKGKDRICVDCTNGPDIKGSTNTSIPKPSAVNADECPPAFYQNSFAHHLCCLWRTCITHPTKEICSFLPGPLPFQPGRCFCLRDWRLSYHPSWAGVFQDLHHLSSVS